MTNIPSFRDDLREVAVFFIAGGFSRDYLGIFEDGVDVPTTNVVDFDETVIKGQALRIVLVNCWQAALFFETVVEVAGQWVREVELREDSGVRIEEDVTRVFVELI